MFTRKPRLRLEKFTINGTKRLLQQYQGHNGRAGRRLPKGAVDPIRTYGPTDRDLTTRCGAGIAAVDISLFGSPFPYCERGKRTQQSRPWQQNRDAIALGRQTLAKRR